LLDALGGIAHLPSGLAFRWSTLVGLFALGIVAKSAQASVSVNWNAPACAPEAEFRERLERALSKPSETFAGDGVGFDVAIAPNARSDYELRVATRREGKRLERALTTQSCDEALDAAVVLVALALDPNAVATSTSLQSPRPQTRRFSVQVSGGVGAGEAPRLTPVLDGGAALELGPAGFMLEGFWVVPALATRAGEERGGEIGLFGGLAAACYVPFREPGRLWACALFGAGAWTSRGASVLNPASHLEPWIGAGLRLRYAQPLTQSLALTLQADGIGAGRRPQFFLDGLGKVYTPPALAFRGGVGLELGF
jgi:hypothetical protein